MSDDETINDTGVNTFNVTTLLLEVPVKAVQQKKISWLNEHISLIFYAIDSYAAMLPLHLLRGNKHYTS
jgi:hypothetical protein